MYQIEELEKWKDKPEKIVYRYSASGDKWIYLILKKGCIAGEHYHKGLVASKNPEINIILKGKVEYYLKDLKSGKTEKVIIEAPKIIKIYPFVYHEIKAIEETLFLEPFDEEAVKRDRFKLDD